ncbi:hypothetical protein CGI93_23470 [Vibrio parahaemolyticus]|uniref:hypothetical protein n=1 Tax=Vibrio parahaemolyticus TaxID=670 RepID=UPI00111F52C4|nr:hypothetical protein [Vibrio parahaemolyticus]TOG79764.1 hypothetical protein CGI93_23470 [Vibrio parahaemolyticus]HCK0618577.1 hypothetical protein [Vibrio parahaemolyticus]
MAKKEDDVVFAVYDIERENEPAEGEPFGEWVEFEIINKTKRRTHRYWAFLDELVSQNVCQGSRCFPACDCDPCEQLKGFELDKFSELKDTYHTGWPVVVNTDSFVMPRGIKFTPDSQVSDKRPKTFEREKRLNRQEIISVIGAINEIVKRHRAQIGSYPYIALPVSQNVDSIYKKATDNTLGVDLHFPVSRVTIEEDGQEYGAAYVIF